MTPSAHLEKAHTLLEEARYLQAGGFAEGAGRGAYLAGFHAALAYIVRHTGREPKTHSGTRAEFARLARDNQQLDPEFVRFLGRSFNLKMSADYDSSEPLTSVEAMAAIEQAQEMVRAIIAILAES